MEANKTRDPQSSTDGGSHFREPKSWVSGMEESLERRGKGERVCWNKDSENQANSQWGRGEGEIGGSA